MANLFDADNAPEGEPTEIVIGDFIQFKRSDLVTDYPNSTHTAEYVARITGGGATEIKLPGTAPDATKYLFTVSSVDSADFVAGYYHWQLEITETASGNRIVVDRGEFTAVVDLDVNNVDPRSHAEIMIDKIESVLQNRADGDLTSYSIAGRSLTKMSPEELISWRDYYRREFAAEKRKAKIKRGKRNGSTVLMRF
jgi:hypothetical protein